MATHLTVHKTPGLGDYTTIQAAITASSNGTAEDRSTVTILDAATYDERLTIGLDFIDIIAAADCVLAPTSTGNVVGFGAAVTVRFLAENGALPVIAPNSASANQYIFYGGAKAVKLFASWRIRLDKGSYWVLAGGIGNGNTQTLSGVVVLPGAGTWRSGQVVGGGACAALTITDCDLYEISNLAPNIDSTTQLVVERSRIRTATLAATGAGGSSPQQNRIINNIITHHHTGVAYGLISGPALTDGGTLIAHNLLIGSGATGGVAVSTPFATTQLINNVIVNFATAAVTVGSVTPTAQNNCIFDCPNGITGGWVATGTITADPKITTDIDPTSPCVDAGYPLPTVTDDILGRVRPQGAGWDIGPYELPHTDPPDPPPPPEPFRGQIATPATLDVDAAGTSYADPPWTWLVDDPNDITALVDSALIWSLGTDSALPRGKLPQPDGTPTPYRGGHWADPLISGLPGSLLWTLRRADWTETTQREGVRAITAALTWLVDAGIIEGVEVSAQPDPGVWLVSYICVITGDRRSRRVE